MPRRSPVLSAGSALFVSFLLGACADAPATRSLDTTAAKVTARGSYDSGGPLDPDQARFDVLAYEVDVDVRPAEKAIRASALVRLRAVEPLATVVLDLDRALEVSSVEVEEKGSRTPAEFERSPTRLRIALGSEVAAGSELSVRIAYGGRPREAPNPPWEGGFTWSSTPSGAPWIATTCQTIGADLWLPVKDHVSDEPDSFRLRVTVPDPLVVAANGRLVERVTNGDGTSTYHWLVTTPINLYNVALNIAPYEVIEGELTSTAGDTFPVVLYVLPEDLEKGRKLFDEILEHLRFFEEVCGPYPFRADKYGVAQTPHLGMEHQTIIAYGAKFEPGAITGGKDWGFDSLHHHELSHEWWGNLVTNTDWRDMWIHEGFGTYMQALYAGRVADEGAYHGYMASLRPRLSNAAPVAPRRSLSAKEVYGGDIYFKGAWILHTLRYLIGDERFFLSLRRMAYPTEALEMTTDGSACRFATTEDFIALVEEITAEDLGWFFEVYLRRAELPRLLHEVDGATLKLRWETVDDLPFPMPVTVRLGERELRVEVPAEGAEVPIPSGSSPEIDPERWILRAS